MIRKLVIIVCWLQSYLVAPPSAPVPDTFPARAPVVVGAPSPDTSSRLPATRRKAAQADDRKTLVGIASWYGARGLIGAAGPALRHGAWRGSRVTVCTTDSPTAIACVRVTLADWCSCRHRLIDLSDDAFRRIAPLSQGLARVSIRPSFSVPLPPTDAVR